MELYYSGVTGVLLVRQTSGVTCVEYIKDMAQNDTVSRANVENIAGIKYTMADGRNQSTPPPPPPPFVCGFGMSSTKVCVHGAATSIADLSNIKQQAL